MAYLDSRHGDGDQLEGGDSDGAQGAAISHMFHHRWQQSKEKGKKTVTHTYTPFLKAHRIITTVVAATLQAAVSVSVQRLWGCGIHLFTIGLLTEVSLMLWHHQTIASMLWNNQQYFGMLEMPTRQDMDRFEKKITKSCWHRMGRAACPYSIHVSNYGSAQSWAIYFTIVKVNTNQKLIKVEASWGKMKYLNLKFQCLKKLLQTDTVRHYTLLAGDFFWKYVPTFF